MGHELACLAAGAGETCTVDDVVETGLEQNRPGSHRSYRATVCLSVVAAELLLHDAVGEAGLLLLLQLDEVLRFLDAGAASLPRGVRATLEGASRRRRGRRGGDGTYWVMGRCNEPFLLSVLSC